MAFTFTLTSLIALASLSGSALAAPAGENIAARADCVSTIYSKAGDTCATIATAHGLSEADIKNANTFLTCNDIWANTPICIVASTTTPTCSSTYYSQSGDTCDSLATKFGVTSDAIHNANSFLTCNDIWANTPICVPAGGSTTTTCVSTYSSASGDTCDTIASKHGLTADAIKNANSFVTCNDIWANTPICIPPGGTTNNNSGSSSSSNCVMTYISESGDTCNSLASAFGLAASAIQSSNSFLNCNDIWANTPICVPSGGRVSTPQSGSASDCVVTYTSTGGDNCDNIGQKFGLEAWEVQNANSFVNCNDIWSGTALCIVSGCA